ncbi:hypothetical protein CYMTET_27898 [Cymbomonas tetramitiformis]|uniref:Uncharacterized protein n=1 Tax=Cymbomonas tetramitiformis TaxID=36881 RepID=A0AAE0FPE8_9CHLO|nr:hypothetical protein CYMTET_27898 [Cymbomonas tetramitiformis]
MADSKTGAVSRPPTTEARWGYRAMVMNAGRQEAEPNQDLSETEECNQLIKQMEREKIFLDRKLKKAERKVGTMDVQAHILSDKAEDLKHQTEDQAAHDKAFTLTTLDGHGKTNSLSAQEKGRLAFEEAKKTVALKHGTKPQSSAQALELEQWKAIARGERPVYELPTHSTPCGTDSDEVNKAVLQAAVDALGEVKVDPREALTSNSLGEPDASDPVPEAPVSTPPLPEALPTQEPRQALRKESKYQGINYSKFAGKAGQIEQPDTWLKHHSRAKALKDGKAHMDMETYRMMALKREHDNEEKKKTPAYIAKSNATLAEWLKIAGSYDAPHAEERVSTPSPATQCEQEPEAATLRQNDLAQESTLPSGTVDATPSNKRVPSNDQGLELSADSLPGPDTAKAAEEAPDYDPLLESSEDLYDPPFDPLVDEPGGDPLLDEPGGDPLLDEDDENEDEPVSRQESAKFDADTLAAAK